ncbi:MAG: ABC transporter ATP-binding protein [bacterium]|nr:ABC transporter ATP-binding protein [bacterium]
MLLEVQNVSVQFGGLRALNGVSFTVDEGEIVGLVGANGAGKSTMVSAVSGALGRHGGRVVFVGRDITGLAPSRIAGMGLVRTFQLVQPFRGLTAIECVTLGALYGSTSDRPAGIPTARRLAERALDFAGLSMVADLACDTLNASQRHRLEIARALAARPKLILLDECLSGLNSSEIDHGITLVRAIRARGIAILIIEHTVRVMSALADRIVVLDRGEKIADGPAADVLTDRRALGVYFGTTA